ncbi:MAG: NnrS family protein [Chromatiales bacterium]|nr:MAG: NnrS family protein [Chromatiales bacterium]
MTVRVLLNIGFRPFYLLGAIFAVVAMAAWLVVFTGMANFGGDLPSVFWHSHEMVFGFSMAVMTGFLFTAVRNWTGQPTPSGWALGAIAAVWVAARILLVAGPASIGVILDVLFLPLVTISIAIPVFRSRNQRNYKVVALVAALAILHFVYHLALSGGLSATWSRPALFTAIDVFVILFAVVGGRVIPAFTKNAVPGSNPVHQTWVEVSAFGLLLMLGVTTLARGGFALPAGQTALLALLAAAAHSLRLALWQPGRTLGQPLLWMMPVAYSWLPLALVLRGLAGLGIVVPGAWIHALTVGGLTSLMVAMMMRSTLGHTGRELKASRVDLIAFLLLQLGAIVRVLSGIVGDHRTMTILAGLIWMAAFAAFLVRYTPMLLRPRADGRPG